MPVRRCKWHCGKEFVSLLELTDHYKKCPNKPTVQPAQKKKVYKTCTCGKDFTLPSTYEQHRQTCKKTR